MLISHETIYRTLYLQTRSVLFRQLIDRLRTKRRMRRGKRSSTDGQRRGQIIAGRATRQAASHLKISPRTVETHRARILRKLGAHSATDLVRIAASCGLIPSKLGA